VYNEEDSFPDYVAAVSRDLLSREEYEFSVLFIDDGSEDRTWELVCEVCARDSRFKGVRLSRNYGSHIALTAGFANADGDVFATLACDLQDPPGVILEFLAEWRAGAQIVWGRRRTREDGIWRAAASSVFCSLIRRFAMPRGSLFTTGSFLLVDKRVADCFRQFQEQNRITFALVAWTGFRQAVVPYHRQRRAKGASGWTLRKMVKAMYDAFIGFSFLPVRLMTFLGVFALLLTVLLSIYLLCSWLTGDPLLGWTSLMLAISLFFGIQFFMMGVTGEYLYRIYAEVVRRPLYFVSDTTEVPQDHDSDTG